MKLIIMGISVVTIRMASINMIPSNNKLRIKDQSDDNPVFNPKTVDDKKPASNPNDELTGELVVFPN